MPNVGRTAAVATLIVAVAVVGVLLLGAGSSNYEVRAIVENAGQLVKGNLVKVGGVTVGTVKSIDLTNDNAAQITLKITDDRFDPLRRGTKATIRNTSLSAVAGREISLVPGPNNAPRIDDHGAIPMTDTQPIVDLDAVLNTLDVQTRDALQGIIHGSAISYAKNTEAGNRGLAALNPALSRTAALTGELMHDKQVFTRLLVTSSSVVSAVAAKRTDLVQGTARAAATADAVAREASSLDTALRLAPRTLRRGNTTLVDLRAALGDVRPALSLAAPVAPRLARVLRVLAPFARKARPVVSATRAILPLATATLNALPSLEGQAVPAFAATNSALRGSSAIIAATRAYTPDLVGGVINGFGGLAAGYYDANGHYARLSANASFVGASGLASLLPGPPNGTAGLRTRIFHRCPGAATQAAADKSNVYSPPEAQCDPKDDPR